MCAVKFCVSCVLGVCWFDSCVVFGMCCLMVCSAAGVCEW